MLFSARRPKAVKSALSGGLAISEIAQRLFAAEVAFPLLPHERAGQIFRRGIAIVGAFGSSTVRHGIMIIQGSNRRACILRGRLVKLADAFLQLFPLLVCDES